MFFPQRLCYGYSVLLLLNEKACNAGITFFPTPSVHQTDRFIVVPYLPSPKHDKATTLQKPTYDNVRWCRVAQVTLDEAVHHEMR